MPSVSKAQQKLFGILHGIQTGRINPKRVGSDALKLARVISPANVRKYATTKVGGLPAKIREILSTNEISSASPYSSPMPDFSPASNDTTPKISNDRKLIAKVSGNYDSTRPRLTKID